jgi:hypothetical protein
MGYKGNQSGFGALNRNLNRGPARAPASPPVTPRMNVSFPGQIPKAPQSNPLSFAQLSPNELQKLQAAANTKVASVRPTNAPLVIQDMRKAGLPPRNALQTIKPTPKPSAAPLFDSKPPAIRNAETLGQRIANNASNPPRNVTNTSDRTDLPPAIEETLNLTETVKEATSSDTTSYTAQSQGDSLSTSNTPSESARANMSLPAPKKFPWFWVLAAAAAVAGLAMYASEKET